MKRRDFLRSTGTFVVVAQSVGLAATMPGCSTPSDAPDAAATPDASADAHAAIDATAPIDATHDAGSDAASTDVGTDAADTRPPLGTYAYPQGLASGDPHASSVVLWTRVTLASGASDPIDLRVDVATDAAFASIVATRALHTDASVDHTVRAIVTSLSADTPYYYRFVAGRDTIEGQTRTAPLSTADVPIRLAWVAAQDYGAGHFGAYRQMTADDDARPATDRIRFVLHLGGFVSDTIGDPIQQPLDDSFVPTSAVNADGTPRVIGPFPSGGGTLAGHVFAGTLDDYRYLYRTVAADPDLRAARARWPFVHIAGDREFAQACWQSQSSYDPAHTLDEPSQRRRVAASQAWFEHLPSNLTGAEGVAGVAPLARDFAAATVSDAAFTVPDANNLTPEPNNLAAIGAMTSYRSLRFGRHVELIVTDARSYRSDHPIPEESTFGSPFALDSRRLLSAADVATTDAGMTANGGSPPSNLSTGNPNPRRTSPVGTMLGATQRAWWKASMTGSDATWRVWGNEIPLTRLRLTSLPGLGPVVLDTDAWDGYAAERRELLTHLADHGVAGVVSLGGGMHGHLASMLLDDFDAAAPRTVGVELGVAGISANSLFASFEQLTRLAPASIRALFTFDGAASGRGRFVENLNLALLHGTTAASAMAATNDLATALGAADPTANPHLRYVDTHARGYGVAAIFADRIEASIVTTTPPVSAAATTAVRTVSFVVPRSDPAAITGPTLTGTRPFPMS